MISPASETVQPITGIAFRSWSEIVATNCCDCRLIAGRYRLARVVGAGGMGRVWLGRDELIDRAVAIKELLLPPGLDDAERVALGQRAMREARAAGRLNHPGIVTVHDVVEHNGVPLIVMEFVRGESLGDVIRDRGGLSVEQVAAIGTAIVDALRAAHEAGIVHRDLKPANVLLAGDRVVITDFGIARLLGDAQLTTSGVILGSPAYMAPEQANSQPSTPASDLWSLGATLYAAVEGRPPFEGADVMATLAAVLTKDPRPPLRWAASPPRRGCSPPETGERTENTGQGGATPRRTGARSAAVEEGAATEQGGATVPDQPVELTEHLQLTGHNRRVTSLAFSPDGTLLAYGGKGAEVRLADTETGRTVHTITDATGDYVAFSPDGRTLAVADSDTARTACACGTSPPARARRRSTGSTACSPRCCSARTARASPAGSRRRHPALGRGDPGGPRRPGRRGRQAEHGVVQPGRHEDRRRW